jgi:hypothetical protein
MAENDTRPGAEAVDGMPGIHAMGLGSQAHAGVAAGARYCAALGSGVYGFFHWLEKAVHGFIDVKITVTGKFKSNAVAVTAIPNTLRVSKTPR